MKAHVKREKAPATLPLPAGEGPYHGHAVRLTIGLIVKNEEKTLDRCLSSLKPLMNAVESELIITDTGSTDRTVEIAKKYTDRILHFEWCDDFAAARNTGLKEARGEWFLFLDGDEWFENTNGLIEFFTSGECDRYGSAAYVIRNYADPVGKQYGETASLRVSRMYPGICFRHAIHEDMGWMLPTKFLEDRVNHDGYAFASGRERRQKFERNRALLERELKKNPDDIKAYYQISKQYLNDDPNLAEKYSGLGLEAERKAPDRGWRLALTHGRFRALYAKNQYERFLNEAEEFMRSDPKPEMVWLDFHGLAQIAAFTLRDYRRSAVHGRAYLRVYNLYRTGRLDRKLTLILEPSLCGPEHRERALCLLAEAELMVGDAKQAVEDLNQLDLSMPGTVSSALRLAWKVCEKTGDWPALAAFYQNFCSSAGEERRAEVQREMAAVLPADQEEGREAVCALASIPWDGDPCVRLCRLRKAVREEDREAAAAELNWFFRWEGEWDPAYSDVIFYGMKEKANLMPLLLKIDAEDPKRYSKNMQVRHRDFAEITQNYFDSFSFENIKGLYWSVCLRETALLSQHGRGSEDDEIRQFEEYARQTAKYVRSLYRQDLLSPDRVSVLPRAHRFGYYMGLALSARDKADDAAYLSNLRFALRSYPVMERQISLLLERFEREDQLRRKKAEEFNLLAGQAKEQIRNLIAQGKLKEAGQFTVRLAALLPNDPDVVKFRALTHTEPDMNELAAHLLQ